MLGAPSLAPRSIHSAARFVADRGTPVVCLMSDYDQCEPGMPQWPSYASAIYFGLGMYHEAAPAKLGQKALGKRPCRGGYVRDARRKPTSQLSFPDGCVASRYFEGTTLRDHIAGLFVAGGGEEVRPAPEQGLGSGFGSFGGSATTRTWKPCPLTACPCAQR